MFINSCKSSCKTFYRNNLKRNIVITCILLALGSLTACGQKQNNGAIGPEELEAGSTANNTIISQEQTSTDASKEDNAYPESTDATSEADTGNTTKTDSSESSDKAAELKAKFGANCITEQTFEVELSEYSGKVYFVALAPTAENPEFSMKIIQNGETLTTLRPYIPEALKNTAFTSLDAVSFYDVNYDSYTDIVTIVTHGDDTFAAVYYGFDADQAEYGNYFVSQEWLSDHITDSLPVVTIKEIRELISNGKKNGVFADYKEAYQAVTTFYELTHDDVDVTYDLIYVDNDDIPELVAGVRGYYASLYTFHDGTVYSLMDDWGYGAMGNAGYEYAPKENNIRNYNTDHAGAILYTSYMAINQINSGTFFLGTHAQITTVNFDDVNKNGMPDEEEYDSIGKYAVYYLGDEEVTFDEIPNFDAEHYEYIEPKISLEELKKILNK